MAKATVTQRVIETIVVKEGGVTLELTPEEAESLFLTIGSIAGDGPCLRVWDALREAGVENEGNYRFTRSSGAFAPRIDRA